MEGRFPTHESHMLVSTYKPCLTSQGLILSHMLVSRGLGGRRFGLVKGLGSFSGRCLFFVFRWRPYRSEYTTTLQNCAVNHYRARIVLRWGTAREVLRVLPAFSPRPSHVILGLVGPRLWAQKGK